MMSTETNSKESKIKAELRQYHSETFEAFSKEGLNTNLESHSGSDLPYDVRVQKDRVNDFLRRAKEDKQPIQKIIRTMKRIPIVERDPKTGKAERKDFLEVHSELRGIDWKDNPLRVTDYFEGYHYEPIINTSTGDRDPDTGDFNMKKEHQGNKKIYEFDVTKDNRKQIIEQLINEATGTFRDEIIFYYEVPNESNAMGFRCSIYSYDQFINSSSEEMIRLARTTPSQLQHSIKDRKSYMS
jgi:hypothetical protein